TKTVDNPRQALMFYIFSKTWLTNSGKFYYSALLGSGIVLQSYFDRSLRAVIFKLIVLDVALVMKHFSNLFLYIGSRNLNNTVRSLDGVPQPGQVISYWISHIIISLTAFPFGRAKLHNDSLNKN